MEHSTIESNNLMIMFVNYLRTQERRVSIRFGRSKYSCHRDHQGINPEDFGPRRAIQGCSSSRGEYFAQGSRFNTFVTTTNGGNRAIQVSREYKIKILLANTYFR
jgi:hypothetical protein